MQAFYNRLRNAIWWRVARAASQPKGVDVAFVTHHKTGTVLAKRMALIAELAQGTTVLHVEERPEEAELLRRPSTGGNRIAVYSHGWVEEADLGRFQRVYHFVRDPAALAISSAIYHQKGSEPWLHAPSGALEGEMRRPVTHGRALHPTEEPDFVQSMLQGKTYHQRISELEMSEAIAFELRMCAGWNIRDMHAFPSLPQVVEVDIHGQEFDFMPFWQSVMEELEANAWALKLMMNQVVKWDRSKSANWSRHAKAHLSGVSDYSKFWTPEHQALLEELGLDRK